MPMVKSPFNGQLNSNEIFSSIYNMIISQQVFADNLKGDIYSLVEKFRTDGTMYGDTKLFYATDVLESHPWGNDAEASNLLALDRPAAPKCQAITLDKFRQIRLTVDNYLTKRAWSTEGTFQNFQSVMLGWIKETKKVYDTTLVNSYVGNVVTTATKGVKSITLPTTASTDPTEVEANKRAEAMAIAKGLADLFVDMKDINRDYNEYGYLRSYDLGDLIVIWNADYVNKIRKIDLPTIFHKDGLMEKFDENILPARYFGREIALTDIGSGKVINASAEYDNTKGTLRSLVEKNIYVGNVKTHVFPGDELPNGCKVTVQPLDGGDTGALIKDTYVEVSDVICKVVHKEAIKYMSAFEVATEFFNARSLTENHYLTFGYAHPDYLKNYPIVVVKAA